MKSGLLLRIIGGLFIIFALLNLTALLLPDARAQLISPATVLLRYSLMLVTGIGFILLRRWSLYVFLTSVTINWITFYTVYEGASRGYPIWLGLTGPVVICIVFYYSWDAIRK